MTRSKALWKADDQKARLSELTAQSEDSAKDQSLRRDVRSLGALLGIWLGLFLTTTPAPWPHGISFAQAGPGFTDGWRWMYAVGAVLAAVGVLLRLELPESARWLVGRGRIDEADKVVSDMEVVAARHGPLDPVDEDIPVDQTVPESSLAFKALFANRTYVRRVIVLLAVWFLAYVTVFGFSAGFTSMLVALKYPPPEAGLITAVGAFGFLGCALFAVAFADRLERKYWLPIGAVITVIGGVIVAEAGTSGLAIAFIGAAIVFFGFNIWVPMTYALSTESFPTRARVTGFGLVDGVGHLGGGIGVLLIAPQIPNMTVLEAMLVISGFLVLAAMSSSSAPTRAAGTTKRFRPDRHRGEAARCGLVRSRSQDRRTARTLAAGVDAPQHGPHVLDVRAHRALGCAPLMAPDRPDDRLMLGDDQIPVDRRSEMLDQRGLEHVEDPAGEGDQQVVAGGDRDRLVKARIGTTELLTGGVMSDGIGDRVRERLDRRLIGAHRRHPRERDLEEGPRLEQFVQRHAVGLEHRRDRLAHVSPDPLVRRVLDEHPAGAALLDADQMGPGQPPQPLSERRSADSEFPRQLVLGPDPVARLEPFSLDVHPDLVSDLLAGVGVHNLEATGIPRAGRSCHAASVCAAGAVRPPVRGLD